MNKNIAVCLYTYDRVDDVRINLEIIKDIWEKSNLFDTITIIHSYNGEENWYPKQYLEDTLIRIANRGHFFGASDLIESGINFIFNNNNSIDYIITLAADTWFLNPAFINNILEKMISENRQVAASCWGNPFDNDPMRMGLSTDFFIINKNWAKEYKLFPLHFDAFYKKYFEILAYEKKVIYLERVFSLHFFKSAQKYFGIKVPDHLLTYKKDELLYRILEREPVHNYYSDRIYRKDASFFEKMKKMFNLKSKGYRNMYWPSIPLLTHHDKYLKQKHLKNHTYPKSEFTLKFINSENLDYFNEYCIDYK